jgi:adenosylmethionine-8-amino-7-oxononanoate aminotransferase
VIERDRAFCWHPYTQHGLDPDPLPVVSASGAWIELADGRRVLDAISSWWACLHGHAHPRLLRALAEQAARLDHVPFAGCTHEPAVALAEALVRAAPPGLSRVFYSDDGSTAVEVALKAAYAFWLRLGERRERFVALQGGYHGDTFGAMAAGDPDPFFRDFEPLLFRVERVPCDAVCLEETLERGGVAAVVLEPIVQGAAGMRPVPSEFLRAARALCEAHRVLLVADEVMTGFGRTGTLFACEQAGIAPDLLCLGKGLTGGMLPLAATLAREEIYEAFRSHDRARAFFHGHTFTANPIGCAVALESLQMVREEDVPRKFRAIGERIAAGVPGARRFGGIVAVDVPGAGGYTSAAGERLRALCRELAPDVLLRPLGPVLYAMPPACTTPQECDRIAAAISAVAHCL